MSDIKLYKLNTTSLLHYWFNNAIPKYTKRGNWEFDCDELKYNRTTVAKRIGKTIYLIKDWEVRYYSSYGLARMIPSNKKYCYVYKIPNFERHYKDKVGELQQAFYLNSKRALDNIAYVVNNINNNRIKYLSLIDIDTTFDLSWYGKRIYNKFLNTPLTLNLVYKSYNGWGRNNYNEYTHLITFKPQQLFEEGGILNIVSDEVKAELKFREWFKKYGYYTYYNYYMTRYSSRYTLTSTTRKLNATAVLRKIYNNPEKRIEHEQKVATIINEGKEHKAKLIKLITELNSELEVKNYQLIEKYRKGEIKNIALPYPVLKYNGSTVITSLGVTISEQAARTALIIYKRDCAKLVNAFFISTTLSTIDKFKYIGIGTSNFKRLVNDKLEIVEDKYLHIGCHKIPDFEIQEFLNFYKLDW